MFKKMRKSHMSMDDGRIEELLRKSEYGSSFLWKLQGI